MKLNERIFALSAAIFSAAAFVVCSIFIVIFPDLSAKLFGWMVHLSATNVQVHVTFGGFLGGLIQWAAYAYAGAWFFVWLYNRMTKG